MAKQITAIIVDDEQDARDGLERMINAELPEVKVIAKTESAGKALELIIDEKPDIVFLDIQMPINDGFWLANKLKKFKNNTNIIFVTAYDEYAIKAIKYAAFDFLTKPVTPEILKETVDRCKEYNLGQKVENLHTFLQKGKIKFNVYNGFIMISHEDIIYCEADRNYSNIHLANGKTKLITSQLGGMEKKLTEYSFVKISRSAIINLDYLESYDRKTKTVVLADIMQKYELSVSASGADQLSLL